MKIKKIGKRPHIEWEQWYDAAKEYYEREGDLLVPERYIMDTGLRLGSWINRLRNRYNNCSSAGRPLYRDEIQAMEAIGMVWQDIDAIRWNEMLHFLQAYVTEHGALPPWNARVQTPDRRSVTSWISHQRVKLRKGLLSDERVRCLAQIGITV